MTASVLALGLAMVMVQPYWTRKPAVVAKLDVADRCSLVSKVVRYEDPGPGPGERRVSYLNDVTTKEAAMWRGKPIVCASILKKERNIAPFFSGTEQCGGDFSVLTGDVVKATDLPASCIALDLTPRTGSRVFTFHMFYGGLRELRGIGRTPVDGAITREGNDWVVSPNRRKSR